jgi:surface antigen
VSRLSAGLLPDSFPLDRLILSLAIVLISRAGVAMSAARFTVIAAIGLTLAACAGDPDTGRGPRENTGTLLGGLAGAAVGSQFGGGVGGHLAGAAIGAGLGALIGNRIGAAMDDEDRQRAYAAQMSALNDGAAGAPVSWRNPDSGRYGTVVPGPYYEAEGRRCRSYTHTIYIDGRPQTARGTACRNPDGTWTPLT